MVARGSEQHGRAVSRHNRLQRGAGLAGLAVVALVVLSGCSVDDAFHFGFPKGGVTDQSQKMFDLWIGSVIAALVVGVLVWGLIFWCIIRYRKRSDELPAQTRYNLPLELLYTVLPFLIIAVLFYYTAITESDVDKVSANPDVTVSVNAFKWNWEFEYPGHTDTAGNVVATVGASDYIPVLVVPTNRTILFKEHSADVIHSFWVPELLFKRDVFPGNVVNQFQVTIVKEGAYVGRCAELCGTYHSMMNFELRAVSPDKFDAFLKARESGMSTPEALTSIGEQPFAVTTHPFDTSRSS
ncbi:MAG TPA: cytochrome c oxidase subunit II [Rugosimonospora sp.]|nr:cytochrome c oxidase subunit II [Rugosimonospora sp.]